MGKINTSCLYLPNIVVIIDQGLGDVEDVACMEAGDSSKVVVPSFLRFSLDPH